MKNPIKLLIVLLLALSLSACSGIVEGVVYGDIDSNTEIDSLEGPLEGVSVQLDGCGDSQTQVTGADGTFNFEELPEGTCTVQVSKACWQFLVSFADLVTRYQLPQIRTCLPRSAS